MFGTCSSATEAYTVPRQSLVSQQRNVDVLLRDDTTLLMNNVFDGSQIYLLLADVGASTGAHKLLRVSLQYLTSCAIFIKPARGHMRSARLVSSLDQRAGDSTRPVQAADAILASVRHYR